MTLQWRSFLLLMLAACTMIVSACGASSSAEQQASAIENGDQYMITDFNNRTITLNGVPERIAALSIGETNIIYSLGGTLVGRPGTDVDFQWEEANDAQVIGTTHDVDLEKVAVSKAQVVLMHNIMNEKDVAKLENIGMKVVLTSGNSVADIKRQIETFGQLLQKPDKATELVAEIDVKIAELAADQDETIPALLVYGAPGTFMAALPHSLAGDILTLAGGSNIAASYPQLANYPQYASLDMERIVESNPQAIFIMTHADPEDVRDQFIAEMESSHAWSSIDAVKNGRIEVLPAELFGSNPGTRIVESLDYMYEALHP
jgi:iron complex transport system substrate-binding protein